MFVTVCCSHFVSLFKMEFVKGLFGGKKKDDAKKDDKKGDSNASSSGSGASSLFSFGGELCFFVFFCSFFSESKPGSMAYAKQSSDVQKTYDYLFKILLIGGNSPWLFVCFG